MNIRRATIPVKGRKMNGCFGQLSEEHESPQAITYDHTIVLSDKFASRGFAHKQFCTESCCRALSLRILFCNPNSTLPRVTDQKQRRLFQWSHHKVHWFIERTDLEQRICQVPQNFHVS